MEAARYLSCGKYDVILYAAQKLVQKNSFGARVIGGIPGRRVGSSLVASSLGIKEVNSLPAHYRVPSASMRNFEYGEKNTLMRGGYPDAVCPICGTPL